MEYHRTQELIISKSNISNFLFKKKESKDEIIPRYLLNLSNRPCHEKNILDNGSIPIESDRKPLFLTPLKNDRIIAAIDVSSVKIGETSYGLICALRGCISWIKDNNYYYLREGPLIFDITPENLLFKNNDINEKDIHSFDELNTLNVISRFRNLLERAIQGKVCNYFTNSIILFDGSLIAGLHDNPIEKAKGILRDARLNNNSVIGISKTTKLSIERNKIISGSQLPYIYDIDEEVRSRFNPHQLQFLGHIYAGRLSRNGFVFRLDIDKELSLKKRIDSLRMLIYRDVREYGYPETLRLAHILSSFTTNEMLGIQRILSKSGFKFISRINIRKFLFGPYTASSGRD